MCKDTIFFWIGKFFCVGRHEGGLRRAGYYIYDIIWDSELWWGEIVG